MSKFILADTNKYELPGTNGQYFHLATIHHGLREYMYFGNKYMESYIEEMTGGTLSKIEDDQLWEALTKFLQEKKVGLMYNHD